MFSGSKRALLGCWAEEGVGWIFGLWLFHFGVCVWKSHFLPRFLGVLLIAACFGYLAVSLTPFLLPSYANIVSRFANIPLTLGEPAAILWLLLMGAKDQPLEAAPGVGVDVRRIPT